MTGGDALLDPERVLQLLAGQHPGAALSDARVRYLELDPGRSLLVLWRLLVDGRQAEVVVSRGRMRPDAATRGAVNRAAGPRAPVPVALEEVGDPPALVAWFPADPGLPLLAGDIAAVARDLAPPGGGGEPRMLAWMPQQRAVVRVGDTVLKLYADGGDAAAAAAAQAACAGWLPAPEALGADPGRGVTAQRVVPGRPLGRDDAVAAAERAGRVIRALHDAPIEGLVQRSDAELLAQCAASARRAAIAAPALAARLTRAGERLAAAMPPTAGGVPSHGDYTVGQLLDDGGRLWVVDTDTLCTASAAHDLAAYAANVVSGRPEDAADAAAALRAIVAGYGTTPPGLDWHLAAAVMRRLDRPLRRLKKRWPERTERMLALAEELLPG